MIVILVSLFKKSMTAYKLEVSGQAPLGLRQYAGFSSKKAVWLSLGISGLMAGIAGTCEVCRAQLVS